jgi:hypothetical protein
LDSPRLEALKAILRDFITCHQFNHFRSRHAKAAGSAS